MQAKKHNKKSMKAMKVMKAMKDMKVMKAMKVKKARKPVKEKNDYTHGVHFRMDGTTDMSDAQNGSLEENGAKVKWYNINKSTK